MEGFIDNSNKRLKKQKKKIGIFFVVYICLLIGCGTSTENTMEENPYENQLDEELESVFEEVGTAPAGYVYDYQVSLDPIPEDVAAYGGECYGTIHAFPSKIKVEMMRRELEKPENKELKDEAERCKKEIIDALEKEYGGKFSAELMQIDWNRWYFYCTDIEVQFVFCVGYDNYGFLEPNRIEENNFDIEIYLFDSYVDEEKENINKIISSEYKDNCTRIFMQKLQDDLEVVTIYIAVFQDEDIEPEQEENRIKCVWNKINELETKNVRRDYTYRIDYYPVEYKTVIEQKYKDGLYMDIDISHNSLTIEKWLENEEILGSFYYDEFFEEEEFEEFIDSKGWKVKGE